jgi:hypothetical protein
VFDQNRRRTGCGQRAGADRCLAGSNATAEARDDDRLDGEVSSGIDKARQRWIDELWLLRDPRVLTHRPHDNHRKMTSIAGTKSGFPHPQ